MVLGLFQPVREMRTRKSFWGVKRVRLTMLPLSTNQLARKCELLDIAEPCWPPQPVTGIALFLPQYCTRHESRLMYCYIPCIVDRKFK
jgi:hypothetical protein